MNDDKADDTPVDQDPKEENEEISQVEQDAINAFGDTKGDLTANEDALEVEEPDEGTKGEDKEKTSDKESDSGDGQTDDSDREDNSGGEGDKTPLDQPAAELKEEKDEEGVYEEPKTEDPGDFKPGDYSFEVKTTDGKTHKISAPEDIDSFAAKLDDDPELITASQFSIFNRKSALMEQGIASDKKEFDANKETFDKEQAVQETRESALKQWNNEINYLAKEGKLPDISEANNRADWSDPEVAKDPAVKARLDLLAWMNQENEKRMSAGLEPTKSLVDAFNNRRLEQIETKDKEQEKTDTQKRRERGSRVGGNAPYAPPPATKGSIVGTGGSLSDLVDEYMMSQ